MKIVYTRNPLSTEVHLDEHEQQIFKLKLYIAELEDHAFAAHFYLQEGEHFNLERARQQLDPDWIMKGEEESTKLDARVDELFNLYISDLQGEHGGDCTCVACSCSKCYAENLLGVDTIPGLGKHPAAKIHAAFNYRDGDKWKTRTWREALEYLRTYEPTIQPGSGWENNPESFAANVPRWKQEAAIALAWFESYLIDNFGERL